MGAPQLVLAACLDEDNQVVRFAGVMTATELQRAFQGDRLLFTRLQIWTS